MITHELFKAKIKPDTLETLESEIIALNTKKLIVVIALILGLSGFGKAQDLLPVRGFCIAAPDSRHLDTFVKFIDEELASRMVNVLVVRIDYNYQFESHPELRNKSCLTKADVKKMVDVCKKHSIRLIPQINLLGHQSWAGKLGNLLFRRSKYNPESSGFEKPSVVDLG